MDIRIGDINNEDVIGLLQVHHEDMLKHSPAESVHALDLSGLASPSVTFWSLWIDNELAGIGALKELNADHAEIKSMHTAKKHLRKGIAQTLLSYIIAQSQLRLYTKLSLETGTASAFLPAQRLYQQFGFYECKPFSDYKEDPYSLFMSKRL